MERRTGKKKLLARAVFRDRYSHYRSKNIHLFFTKYNFQIIEFLRRILRCFQNCRRSFTFMLSDCCSKLLDYGYILELHTKCWLRDPLCAWAERIVERHTCGEALISMQKTNTNSDDWGKRSCSGAANQTRRRAWRRWCTKTFDDENIRVDGGWANGKTSFNVKE